MFVFFVHICQLFILHIVICFYLLVFPLDLEKHENAEDVPLQPLNGALSIVGGYILFTEQEFIVLKRLKGNHRYSVGINQIMIINLLPFLNCSAQFKILNYNYIYYTNFNTHQKFKTNYAKLNIRKLISKRHPSKCIVMSRICRECQPRPFKYL